MKNTILACHVGRIGIKFDTSRVLTTFMNKLGCFIKLVTYWWDLFSFNRGVGSCIYCSWGCFCLWLRFMNLLDLLVLPLLSKVVRLKECSRSRVGYVSSLGGVYYCSSSNMVLKGICGLSMIAWEKFSQLIGMVLIWFIDLELEQECNHPSHSLVVCAMFSSSFMLVEICVVKGTVCYRKVRFELC